MRAVLDLLDGQYRGLDEWAEERIREGAGLGLDEAAMMTLPARSRFVSSTSFVRENKSVEGAASNCSRAQRPSRSMNTLHHPKLDMRTCSPI